MIEDLGQDDAWSVYLASLMGVPELAVELERLGLSDWNEALEDARELIPELHEAMEREKLGICIKENNWRWYSISRPSIPDGDVRI